MTEKRLTPINRLISRGGQGSGHFGHAGRPGEQGGSAPSGEGGGTPSPFQVRIGLRSAYAWIENIRRYDGREKTAIARIRDVVKDVNSLPRISAGAFVDAMNWLERYREKTKLSSGHFDSLRPEDGWTWEEMEDLRKGVVSGYRLD